MMLHNEELHDLYGSSSIVRIAKCGKLQWAENIALRFEESRNAHEILVSKSLRNWSFGDRDRYLIIK
jgi:hypothetical protein